MRFAYLIMAHDNPNQLRKLLTMLDYSDNDIYLHIDNKNEDIDINSLKSNIKKAKINIYKRFDIYWADISQTRCQLFLLEEAVKDYHDYYHLLSGKDLPIKNHKDIVDFFKKNNGKEFVHFEKNTFFYKMNCSYFHPFYHTMQIVHNARIKRILNSFHDKIINLQKHLKVQRKLYCGANWFSITHGLAYDLIKNKKKALNKVRWTISSDECILQNFIKTISDNKYDLFNTDEDNYISIMRNIDWKRGNPYVWRSYDFDELVNSPMLYARKFDEKIDSKIIKMIADYLDTRVGK